MDFVFNIKDFFLVFLLYAFFNIYSVTNPLLGQMVSDAKQI